MKDIFGRNGKLVIKLGDYLEEIEMPKLRLSKMSGIDYRTILRYCDKNHPVQNLKVFVLEAICDTLNCQISDVLEFVKDTPPKAETDETC